MVASKLVEGQRPGHGFLLCNFAGRWAEIEQVTEENVIAELAGIAFDDGCGDGCNLVVKTADKLRALELLYKYLGLGDKGGGLDKVVIVDDVGGSHADGLGSTGRPHFCRGEHRSPLQPLYGCPPTTNRAISR